MFRCTDQLQKPILLTSAPTRIVSLVPSQTELLAAIGLNEEVIGITKFCVHPTHWFRHKQRIGGTKNVDIEKIRALQPDLIIANKEENVQEQVLELEKIAPVWTSDIHSIEDALSMMQSVGALTGKTAETTSLITTIEEKRMLLQKQLNDSKKRLRVVYLIWKDPYMAAGGDSFIDTMLQACGWENCLGNRMRYPEINLSELAQLRPDLVLLSSEPYPFQQKHITALQQVLPGTKIVLADGEMFSWYGSRMADAFDYFRKMLQEAVW
ncbi:MAG: cobalamin-binding protein [Chitinophagaceae bacterium]|nr:MAG: cobalamin-binding protein [Chitinophagaceae bacterium]